MSEAKQARSYRDLIVWQKGIQLVKRIYELTATFPIEERYGLVSQMRRAAVSIPSNLAEGQARYTTREFVQFISHAEGSAAELDTQLVVSQSLGYCSAGQANEVQDLLAEIRKMLNAMRRKLAIRF